MKTIVHKQTFSSVASLETDPGSVQGRVYCSTLGIGC